MQSEVKNGLEKRNGGMLRLISHAIMQVELNFRSAMRKWHVHYHFRKAAMKSKNEGLQHFKREFWLTWYVIYLGRRARDIEAWARSDNA